MIRKPSRRDATRLACGTLVAAASVFTVGVGIASSADAQATAITAAPAQATYPVSMQATINATVTGTPTSLQYIVTAGPDAAANNAKSKPCNPIGGNPPAGQPNYTCKFTNGGTPGTDTVQVFDDVDGSNTVTQNDILAAPTNVTFAGAPTTLTVTPSPAGPVSVGNAKTYTATPKDGGGNAVPSEPVAVTVTEVSTASVNRDAALTIASGDTTVVTTPAHCTKTASGTPAGTTQTYVCTATATTTSAGTAKYTVTSTIPGSVTVRSSVHNDTVSYTDTYTVTGGLTGDASVKTLAVTPTAATGATGSSLTYKVVATDSTGAPVAGATVRYDITSGPDATLSGQYGYCTGTTLQSDGSVNCTITNINGAGVDAITFYVNQSQTTTTPGPDPGEPQVTATATFTAQPVYDRITLTCTDNTSTPATQQNSCTEPSTAATTVFTALVSKKDGQGVEQPVSGALVNFTASPGATLSAPSATTGADGTATVTLTRTAATPPSTGTYSVIAIVGTGDSFVSGGSGNKSVTASVTYRNTGSVQNITLAPANQTDAIGGTATLTATVTDQFGNPATTVTPVKFTVTGRNTTTGTVNTNASGVAVFTYTDTGSKLQGGTDSVKAVAGNFTSNTAAVNWVASVTASQLTVSYNQCYTAAQAVATTPTPVVSATSDSISTGLSRAICATVQNAAGDVLTGQAVTFTVDKGIVTSSTSFNTTPTTTTVTVPTNSSGQAVAYVGSSKTGVQTTTVTTGTLSKTVTDTYGSGVPATIALTPTTASIAAGGSQKFTAVATDAFGNPASFFPLTFQQSGPGNIGGASSATVTTDATGTATVTLSVPDSVTSAGTGTLTVLYQPAAGTQGSPVSAMSTYTVTTTPVVTKVVVNPGSSIVVRNIETSTATVTDASGNPVANTTVSFGTSGTQVTSGTATTNSSGVATFAFRTLHAGNLTVKATAGAVSSSATVAIAKQIVTVRLSVVSVRKGVIELTAYASPVTGVVAGAPMGFFQREGAGYVGPARKIIGSNGGARIFLNRPSGSTATFYAAVAGQTTTLNPDVQSGKSALVSVRVK